MVFKFFFSLLFISSLVLAQTTLDLDQQIQDMMNRQRDLIESMMKDEDEFNKRVEQLFEKLHKQGAFGSLNKKLFEFRNSVVNTKWVEVENKKKLIIDLDPKEDKVNIDIKSGIITIKGKKKVMNKFKGQKDSYGHSMHNFQKSLSLPNDIDQTSAKFKTENGKIVVVFDKLGMKKVPLQKIKTKGKNI